MYNKLLLVIGFLLLVNINTKAQISNSINLIRDSLNSYGEIILDYNTTDHEKKEANVKLTNTLLRVLNNQEKVTTVFDSLKTIAVLEPSDKSFVLYNWEMPLNDGTFNYYAYILYQNPISKKTQVIELNNASNNLKSPERAFLSSSKWLGTHYYKLITVRSKRKNYYCMLGIDWNNQISTKKVIEVMTFDKQGNIKFGAPIFEFNNSINNRVIFEYNSNVSMYLDYDEKLRMIVFDHLSPIQESLKGQYQFYAPDLSYDWLKFKKGKWHHIENIDARNLK